MPKEANNSPSIELTCSLCPKTPKFSDTSHLLTHISSKSHLSHRFKLQIRAQSEPEAKEKLDIFDYWYQGNNLGTMLSSRLAAKEQKKVVKERKSKNSNTSNSSTSDFKMEPKSGEAVLATTPAFRAPVPRMHLWPTVSISTSTPIRSWEGNSMYSTPTMRREVPNFALAETPVSAINDSKLTTPRKPERSEEGNYANETKQHSVEKVSDTTRLKGVLWPGMDLFDSATPQMKRMRNQRKDNSVLEQMMATSAGVEPTEIVYRSNGQVSHARDIFGPLSTENSPNQDASPKKRKSSKKVALSDLSVNAPRIRVPRPKRSAAARTPLKRPSAAIHNRGSPPHSFKTAPILNPLAEFSQSYVPSSEEDEEFRMIVGDMTKKRTFGIFHDAPEISPGRTESSLEDHRFDFSGDHITSRPKDMKSSNYISPTPTSKQPAIVKLSSGKENGQSVMPSQIDVHQNISTSASHIYPGQVLYDPTFNPLYNHNFARAFPYGTQQHGYNDDLKPPPPRFHSSFHGEFRPIHPSDPCPSGQQSFGTRSNVGHGMHYGG